MNDFSVILQVLEVTAWPVTCLSAIFLFRMPLLTLLHKLPRLSYRDLSAEFQKPIQDLVYKAERAELPELPPLHQKTELSLSESRLFQLAEISPRSAVYEVCREMEGVAHEVADRFRQDQNEEKSARPIRVGDQLFLAGALDQPKFEIFNRVRELRDTALHAKDIDLYYLEIFQYIQITLRLARYLKALPAPEETPVPEEG